MCLSGNRSGDPMRDPQVTSKIMKRIPQKDTRAEVMLRSELFRRGLRYRKNVNKLPGRPDIVFPSVRLVVFVDGDFWHGREWRTRGFARVEDAFKTNTDFWVRKIEYNVSRDKKNNKLLEEGGYTVLRFWASAVESNSAEIADKVEKKLRDLQEGKR